MSVYNPPTAVNVMPAASADASDAPRRRSAYRIRFGGPLQLRRAAERETLILLMVSYLDMMTTLYWVSIGRATEANPLLQWTFDHHPVAFVIVKMLATMPAIFLAPKLAQKHPTFTVWLLRGVIAAYLFVYFKNI
jgi:hypothetical protein